MTEQALNKAFNQLAKDMYEGNIPKGQINIALANFTATYLMKSVTVGYGKGFDDVDYDTPDYEMLTLLEQNIYPFAGAKTLSQLEDMRNLLFDANGNIKDFNQFAADTLNIHTQYNLHWLRAEYNHAIAASTMAARWQDIQNDKDIYPNLIYQTIGDERVRPQHAVLDNIIRPVDDAFWTWAYPPNGWNCRCDAQQTTENETENTLNKNDIPEMFRNNVGMDGSVFSKKHPYYQQANATANDIKKQLAAIQPDRKAMANTFQHIATQQETATQKAKQQLNDDALWNKAQQNIEKLLKNTRTAIQLGKIQYENPLDTLFKVLNEGVLTLFEVGASGGTSSIERRATVELKIFGIENTKVRPRYGYLIGSQTPAVLRYGSITIELTKTPRQITTFTADDSFHGEKEKQMDFIASRFNNPQLISFINQNYAKDIRKTIENIANAKNLKQLARISGHGYIEAQIHSPVSAELIQRIQIPQSLYNRMTPTERKTLKQNLDNYNINLHLYQDNVV